ncbi:sugar-transfer associated ATP-grasp domain-containing protein [Halosolutus gelatinilyticus]|uniref:sugar-transfer associated ATP-grasp domain-containing protein n=1 Tax=Halosolutus gelatinilyticus TaxID=2931975 RepID=UPI001FF2E08E|nr:sugar-transfer associated ATP-grasp domain-containing protein [Halosolutus gelatinilyticus]
MNVRELYRTAKGLQGLASTEFESDGARSLRRRLWLWRRGFVSPSDAVYDLTESTYEDYLTDYQRYVGTRGINGTWSVALSNKLLFHRVMGPFDDYRMAVYGMLRDGAIHPVDGPSTAPESPTAGRELTDGGRAVPASNGADSETVAGSADGDRGPSAASATRNAAQRVVERLDDEGALVLKWVRGGGGNNVLLCERTDDGFLVNGDRYPETAFRSLVADLDEYLVCEFVEQGSFSAGFYPTTPNTLRVITMYDDEAGEPFVAAAIHRMGTAESEPLDNFTQGGLSAAIDRETGALSAGARPPVDGEVEWHSAHPDTGTQIEGERVPGWSRIRDRLLEIADVCSFVPYVGWDVIVTGEDGEFTIIEANSYPGMKSVQVHGPLLADDRVRRFYERRGVC